MFDFPLYLSISPNFVMSVAPVNIVTLSGFVLFFYKQKRNNQKPEFRDLFVRTLYINPNSSYGSFCSFGTTSLANLSKGSSYPQSNCPTVTSTNGFILSMSIMLAIASRKKRAACLDWDVALFLNKQTLKNCPVFLWKTAPLPTWGY